MKRPLLITTLCFIALHTIAQVPGYLGKKISVGYRAEFTPHFTDYIFESIDNKRVDYTGNAYSSASTFNRIDNIDFEVVVASDISFKAAYGTTKYGIAASSSSYIGQNAIFRENFPELFDFQPEGRRPNFDFIRANVQSYRVGLVFSDFPYISPHGKATGLYILYNVADVQTVLNNTGTQLLKEDQIGVMLERTRRRILMDNLILEYGTSFGYILPKKIDYILPITSDYEFQYFLRKHEYNRIMFQIHIGLRFMLPRMF